VSATCAILGSEGNVAAGSLNRYTTNLSGLLTVTNAEAASGGTDVETLEEVRQRFYSLIRRPNPVSKEDWENFFIDLFGIGTVVTTIPRRSAQYEPLSPSDEYGHVSHFLLKPNLQQPGSEDIKNINNLIKVSCPNEFESHVYPIELNDVEVFAKFKYNADLGFTRNLETLSQTLRGYFTNVFLPDEYWPLGYAPSVGDIQGALVNQIGSFTSPDVLSLKAYFTPPMVGKNLIRPSILSEFVASTTLLKDELVQQGNSYFPIVFGFTPTSGSQKAAEAYDQVILSKVKAFDTSVGSYEKNDVILTGGAYYVVLEDFVLAPNRSLESYQSQKVVESTARVVKVWANGLSLTPSDIVVATDADFTTTVDLTSQPLAWLPVTSFVVPNTTNTIASAQASGFLSSTGATVSTAVDGTEYTKGEYIQVEQVDALRGVLTLTYLVETDFTYSETQDFSEAVREVKIFQESDFSSLEFRYEPRFAVGEYLLDRQTNTYYQALKSFTPHTKSVSEMVADNFLTEISFVPATSRPIFRVIEGDTVTLLSGRVTRQYESTANFTPLFEASSYTNDIRQFLVERNDLPQSTADFFDASYNLEDVIYTEVTGGLKLFRVMRPFTAPARKTDFTGSEVNNTARIEELHGNLLQIVEEASCDESIFSRTGDSASLNSLGSSNFKFVPDNGLQYVTQIVIEEDGTQSFSPSLQVLQPVDYGEGTFAL
jgi:hypothetical protein